VLVSTWYVPVGQPGEHVMPVAVMTGCAPSGQPPPSQGFGVTLTVLLLAFEGDA
jgi:hypothetical protein